uniref:LamG-like jellyroll fold domain-containing protein n=1 Tax=Nonomuraea lactucae TaxID=2249762 RepID=UPI001966870F
HLAITYDGTKARLHLNGTQIGEKPFTGTLPDDSGALHLGGNTIYGEHFKGTIDDVRIYNRAQTPTEITTDMNTPLGGTISPAGPQSPAGTVATSSGGSGTEVCTSKTAPVSFTTPGTPPPDPVEDVRHLTLGKDSFVIKTARTNPTACNGGPCTVTDSTTMQIGGTGTDKTAAVIGFKLDELPDGAGVTEALLTLGTPTCAPGNCPTDTTITVTPLKSLVTDESKGSELAGDIRGDIRFELPVTAPHADIAGSEYQWVILTSNKNDIVTFGEVTAAQQPSLVLRYIPAGPPSKVLNLAVAPGDGSAIASWGIPETNGSVALLDGYDIELVNSGGDKLKNFEVREPYAAISDISNGTAYTVRVRAKTAFGVGEWESASVTPKAVPPPPNGSDACIPFLDSASTARTKSEESGAQAYIDRVRKYYQAQDAVLEGKAQTVWDTQGVTPRAPSTAKLSLLNTWLVEYKASLEEAGESRANSSTTLETPVVEASSGGIVKVTAGIKRSWTEEGPPAAATPHHTAARTSGQVEPSEPTILVHVFDRCGNMTVIEVPIETNQDPTDFSSSPNAGGAAGPSGPVGNNFTHRCNGGVCWLNLFGWDYRIKGLRFEAGGDLRWHAWMSQDADPLDGMTNAYSWVRPESSYGKTKLQKLQLRNLNLSLTTTISLKKIGWNPSISWPPGMSPSEGEDTTASAAFTAHPGAREIIYPAAPPVTFKATCQDILCVGFSKIRQSVSASISILGKCKKGATKIEECKQSKPQTIAINPAWQWAWTDL